MQLTRWVSVFKLLCETTIVFQKGLTWVNTPYTHKAVQLHSVSSTYLSMTIHFVARKDFNDNKSCHPKINNR